MSIKISNLPAAGSVASSDTVVVVGTGPTTLQATVTQLVANVVVPNATNAVHASSSAALDNPVNLTTDVTGTLPIASGGTGLTSVGTALQYLRTDSTGTVNQYADLASTGVLTEIVYQEGGATAAPVYATWAEIQAVIAVTVGPIIIYVDDSIVGFNASVVPGGSGVTDCKNLVTLATWAPGTNTVLGVPDGATLKNLLAIDGLRLDISSTATQGLDFSYPYNASSEITLLNGAAIISTTGSVPSCIIPDASTLVVNSQYSENYANYGGITLSGNLILFQLAAAGSELIVTLNGPATVADGCIDGAAGTVTINYTTGLDGGTTAPLSPFPTFATFSGTLNWIGLSNPLCIPNTTATTATYDAHPGELIRVDSSGGNVTINLPSLASFNVISGSHIIVKASATSGNTINVTPNGAETIDGVAAADVISPATVLNSRIYVADVANTNWVIVAGF